MARITSMNGTPLAFRSMTDFGHTGESHENGRHTHLSTALRDIDRQLAPRMVITREWRYWVIDASGATVAGIFDKDNRPSLKSRR